MATPGGTRAQARSRPNIEPEAPATGKPAGGARSGPGSSRSRRIDEATVREFLTLISRQAAQACAHINEPGYLQLTCIHPIDRAVVPTRFEIGDVEGIVEQSIADALEGYNVYVEGRTLTGATNRGNGRGKIEDTDGVLVIDRDADKNKAGNLNGVEPSLSVQTSAGNSHDWLFLDRAISAPDGQLLRAAIWR